MKILSLAVLAALMLLGLSARSSAENWQDPVIKGYGYIVSLPNAAVQPDKSIQYKVLFDVTDQGSKMDQMNEPLDHVARFINVYASAGMPADKLKLVVIIHGAATPVVLKNDTYKSKYGADNPNIPLINDLKKNGVVFFVCGQALADNEFQHDWVNPDVTIALSALTVVPTYQLMGYALMPW